MGKIHALFPFTALAKEWGLCEHSVGRHAYFSAEGKIALMVGLHCAFGQCADCAVKFQYPLSTLLDTGTYGIPVEKTGSSNNAKGAYGPPTFDDCKFTVEEDTVIYITLTSYEMPR